MAELEVSNEFAQFLIDEGVAVDMKDADGVHPVVVDAPKDGAPAPIAGKVYDLTPGTITLGSMERPGGEDHSRLRTVVTLAIRAPTNGAAKLIIRSIQSLLVPEELYGGKSIFPMGAITRVDHCTPFRVPQPVRVPEDEDGYAYDMAFEFVVRRKILAEQPDP